MFRRPPPLDDGLRSPPQGRGDHPPDDHSAFGVLPEDEEDVESAYPSEKNLASIIQSVGARGGVGQEGRGGQEGASEMWSVTEADVPGPLG
jgi:hypothetical protein